MKKTVFLILIVFFSGAVQPDIRVRPAYWAQPIIGTDLHNLYKVSDDVYRSSQPDEEDFPILSQLGIRSILNLRHYHEDEDEDEVEGAEFNLQRLKLDATGIKDDDLAKAMLIIDALPKPILVHCWHGSDRTGAVIATYRMVFQNWSKKKAIDEFLNGGYGYHAVIFSNIEELLENLDIQKIREQMKDNIESHLRQTAH